MAMIRENRAIAPGFHLMRLDFPAACAPGQFIMLRAADGLDPFLPRPISVFDWEDGALTLLYQAVGRGTAALSRLLPGQEIELSGPLGSGFPLEDRDLIAIGGGIGIAPLYYLLKEHKRRFPEKKRIVYLGFRAEALLEDEYRALADALILNLGGFVTDDVDFTAADVLYCACGPTPMLKAAAKRAAEANARLYVSLEERMACGVGACLGCTIETKSGNRRVCKDGPVFPAGEVFVRA